jgi:hypothetical protein
MREQNCAPPMLAVGGLPDLPSPAITHGIGRRRRGEDGIVISSDSGRVDMSGGGILPTSLRGISWRQ